MSCVYTQKEIVDNVKNTTGKRILKSIFDKLNRYKNPKTENCNIKK